MEHAHILWFINSTLRYVSNANVYLHNMYWNIDNTIHNRLPETTQVPINSRIDRFWYIHTMEYTAVMRMNDL